MTDTQILEIVTSARYAPKLSESQREAFTDMLERGDPLSRQQRRWLYSIAESLGIEVAPAENAFSALSAAKQVEQRDLVRTKLPWERPGYVKATKPPGVGR